MMSSIIIVESFVSPSSYNHGMVRRIIESTKSASNMDVAKQQQQQIYDKIAFSFVGNRDCQIGYCNSWG